jgi:hypothetical protein
LLFFVPGIKTTLLGFNLDLPQVVTQLMAWLILGGFLVLQRRQHDRLRKEIA